MNKILNIIVFYNNYDEVLNYITSVNKLSKSVDIMLVINSDKSNNSHALLDYVTKNLDTKVFLKDYGENIGYLNALLYGIRDISLDSYKYVILSNTDILYRQIDFFEKLLSNDYDSMIGCIAPSVYCENTKSYANPHYIEKVPKSKIVRNRFIFSHPFLTSIFLKLSSLRTKKKQEKKPSQFVYCPHGSYMIFSNAFAKSIRDYHHQIKLYNEEGCIGGLLEKKSYKCFYDKSIEVVHLESQTTGKINQKLRYKLWKESFDYLLKEFY